MTHKQTWWDKEIKEQFNEFKSWVGPTTAETKVWARKYILNQDYKSIVDIGCGMCDEYHAYHKEKPGIWWVGVDSSEFLSSRVGAGIVVNEEGHNTKFKDSEFDVAYSRHVLEHQKNYKPILTEMIRIGSKEVIHIFFIAPRDKEIINYNSDNNLYHNTYDRNEIEQFLKEHPKVGGWYWKKIGATEEALIIATKNRYKEDWYNKSEIE